jgi:hypothetical protein
MGLNRLGPMKEIIKKELPSFSFHFLRNTFRFQRELTSYLQAMVEENLNKIIFLNGHLLRRKTHMMICQLNIFS